MTETESVRLPVLAIELDSPVEELAAELGRNVFRDAAGIRCCTAARAAELIEARAQRRKEADERRARRAAKARAEADERRAAGIARGRALRESASRGESQIKPMRIAHVHEVQSGGDVLPVAAMMAGAEAEYAGGVATPRPSAVDWLMGESGGGTFGPPPRRRKGETK